MQNKEQVYSMAGEHYYDYKDLMKNLREYHNKGESVEVWEADKKEWKHDKFIRVDDLICSMQCEAMDNCREIAEEYLDDLTEDKKLDLKNHIAEWFDKNAKLDFYGVENEHKIVVIVE